MSDLLEKFSLGLEPAAGGKRVSRALTCGQLSGRRGMSPGLPGGPAAWRPEVLFVGSELVLPARARLPFFPRAEATSAPSPDLCPRPCGAS